MPKTQTYQDKSGDWRWRRVADNGKVIATSGEGYKNRDHALRQAEESFPSDEHEHPGHDEEMTGTEVQPGETAELSG